MAIDVASISFHRAGRQGSCTTAGASVCMRRGANLRKDKAFHIVDVPLGRLIDRQQGDPANYEERVSKRKVDITGMAGMVHP